MDEGEQQAVRQSGRRDDAHQRHHERDDEADDEGDDGERDGVEDGGDEHRAEGAADELHPRLAHERQCADKAAPAEDEDHGGKYGGDERAANQRAAAVIWRRGH